jgi:hypothetical protein
MAKIKKRWVSWEELEKIVLGNFTPSGHTHPGTDITSIVANSNKIDGREIYVSDNAPTEEEGAEGDLWFEY